VKGRRQGQPSATIPKQESSKWLAQHRTAIGPSQPCWQPGAGCLGTRLRHGYGPIAPQVRGYGTAVAFWSYRLPGKDGPALGLPISSQVSSTILGVEIPRSKRTKDDVVIQGDELAHLRVGKPVKGVLIRFQ